MNNNFFYYDFTYNKLSSVYTYNINININSFYKRGNRMKCKNCGNENNEGAKYCSKCGENLEFQKDKKSSDKKLMIILSVIIAIIIILILVIALIFKNLKNQSLNVTINNNDLNNSRIKE